MQGLRRATFFCTTSFFLLFLSFGNFLRLLESSLFPDGWLVSEGILYGLCLLCSYFIEIPISDKLWMLKATSCLFCSFLWGYYLQGWDTAAALYAVRLAATIVAIYVLFRVFCVIFAKSISAFFAYLCIGYTVSLLLGFVLYIFFPDSEKLWMFLEQNHVGFYGDPHIGRFVSVYFDPNYYATIGGFIFLLCGYLYATLCKKRYAILGSITALSIFLTWSRSGIALFVGLCLCQLWYHFKGTFLSRKRIYIAAFFCLSTALYLWCYLEEGKLFLERVLYFLEDESALYRWETFQFGLDVLEQQPFFGVGINFLQRLSIEAIGLNSLDSSLLSLLVQIGIIPFIALIFYVGYKAVSFFSYQKIWQEEEVKAPYFFSLFWIYGLGVALFASQFNNLLFYPFWLLPFGVTALFLKERCNEYWLKRNNVYLCISTLD